jgi:LAGLIDADG endonuclease
MNINSNNNNKFIQSAGNLTGSSETICQLSNTKTDWFRPWFAGVMDGDGNFDIRNINNKPVLKAIRIKVHIRDIQMLNVIKNHLHFGRINFSKNKPYCTYIISIKSHMVKVIHLINGLIRIKVPGFEKACNYLNIGYVQANYTITPFDPYFAGLIDTDGSILFNYPGNRIECNLELKYTQYSKKLCLEFVVPNYKPNIYLRIKKNQTKHKTFKSIAFKYQTVNGMIFIYEYFMKNKLYCDIKFYRISKIKHFMEIRHYQKYPKSSLEFQIYSKFLLDFIKHLNPLWTRTPFVKKLDKEIVHNHTLCYD